MTDIEYGKQEKLHEEWWEEVGEETARNYNPRLAARMCRMMGIEIGMRMQAEREQA